MYQFLSYLWFYIVANNQHGVHSPFVYDYVTKCLYKKTKLRVPVSLKILIKSISYFGFRTIRLLGDKVDTQATIETMCSEVTFTPHRADVVFTDINALHFKDLDPDRLQNNTLLLVDYIHKNKDNFKLWEKVLQLDQVRISIDLFYCGVVFFRKEQAKEHFKIRI